MNSKIDLPNEDSFSIEDKAVVYYRKLNPMEEVTTHTLTRLDPFNNPDNTQLIQAFASLNEESNHALFAISTQSAELASYLNILEIKINLLVEKALTPLNKQHQAAQKIILSQYGLSFGTSNLFMNNDLISLKFILYPSYQILTLVARVTDSYPKAENKTNDPNFEYWTQTSFENLHPLYDQWIAKHIFHKQIELRNQQANH